MMSVSGWLTKNCFVVVLLLETKRELSLGPIKQIRIHADLAPSNYFLIRNLKYHLPGTWFTDDESMMIAVEA